MSKIIQREPRYDAVYYNGVAWLDSLAKDPNEQFICGYCGKVVKGRYLFCSQECEDDFTKVIEATK